MHLVSWQAQMLIGLQSVHGPVLDQLAVVLSWAGNYGAYLWLGAVLYWMMGSEAGLSVLLLAVCAMVSADLAKWVSAVRRPIGYPGIRSLYTESAGGTSFPSGHALVSMAVCLYVANWLRTDARSVLRVTRRIARWLALILPFCIGVSRLYTGVHWPLDVAVGWVIGFWLYRAFLGYRAGFDGWWALLLLLMALAVPLGPDTRGGVVYVAAVWLGSSLLPKVSPVKVLRRVVRLLVGVVGGMLGTSLVTGIPGATIWAPVVLGVWTAVVGVL